MKRKSLFDNVLMIIGAAAIILIIVLAGRTLENERLFPLRHVASSHQSGNNEYMRIRDSLETVIECEETQLSDLGVSQFMWTIGISKLLAPYSCDVPVRSTREKKESSYLSLAGYKISKESAFYLEGNKYMIAFCQQDLNNSSDSCGRYVTKQIPVRYVKPALGFQNPQFGYVLVPIEKRFYWPLEISMMVVSLLVLVLVVYYAVFRTLRIILRISRGRVFSHQNTRDLLVAGRVFMALAIIPLVLQLIFYYVFRKEIPAQITPAFARVFWENNMYFIIGFIMLLVAKAFEKGHRLQKENFSIV